jgi:RNA polymerase sigma-70 factor (ECF subfamily)
LTRELESRRWFEKSDSESPGEKAAMQCLSELPPDQREVIVLKIWHQYTFDEIGRLLDISPNTAAGRYRYGLQKLRTCLKGENYERHESIGETIGILDSAPPVA